MKFNSIHEIQGFSIKRFVGSRLQFRKSKILLSSKKMSQLLW